MMLAMQLKVTCVPSGKLEPDKRTQRMYTIVNTTKKWKIGAADQHKQLNKW
jgi:hypothetical protein